MSEVFSDVSEWMIRVPARAHVAITLHEQVPDHIQRVVVVVGEHAVVTIDDVVSAQRIEYVLRVASGAQVTYGAWCAPAHEQRVSYRLIAGRGSCVRADVAVAVRGQQNLAIASVQQHNQPRAQSSFSLRGVAFDEARISYSGTIVVAPGAVKTDAQQRSKFLLLSQKAQAHARPQLEIACDDVQCQHGSAISYLDEEQLWYCAARTLSADRAQQLLVEAFLTSGILEHTDVRMNVQSYLRKVGTT